MTLYRIARDGTVTDRGTGERLGFVYATRLVTPAGWAAYIGRPEAGLPRRVGWFTKRREATAALWSEWRRRKEARHAP